MNYIFLIIYCNILLSFSVISLKPKLCIDCKFFTKNIFISNKFGKCSLFPIKEIDNGYLIDGVKNIKNVDYQYCSISREYEHMCGKEGKLYEKKI